VVLTDNRTDTRWFNALAAASDKMCFARKRARRQLGKLADFWYHSLNIKLAIHNRQAGAGVATRAR
jgi:hypothetical protein